MYCVRRGTQGNNYIRCSGFSHIRKMGGYVGDSNAGEGWAVKRPDSAHGAEQVLFLHFAKAI